MRGWALFSNYLSSYAVLAASVIMPQMVIRLEERELRSRFGPPA